MGVHIGGGGTDYILGKGLNLFYLLFFKSILRFSALGGGISKPAYVCTYMYVYSK